MDEKVVLISTSGKVTIITLPQNEVSALCRAFIEYKNNSAEANRVYVVQNNTERSYIDLESIGTIQVQTLRKKR